MFILRCQLEHCTWPHFFYSASHSPVLSTSGSQPENMCSVCSPRFEMTCLGPMSFPKYSRSDTGMASHLRTTTPCRECYPLEGHWTNWSLSAFAQQSWVSYRPSWVINGLRSTGSTFLWIPRNPGTNRVNTALRGLLSHLPLHKSPVLPEAWQLVWVSLQQRETVFWKYFQPPHIFMKLPPSCFSAYISPDAI